jgi:muramoyltetrapeptide carboxypeptidase
LADILAPRLSRGDKVAVVSPASHANPDLVRAGCERLKQHGYEPICMPHALARGPLYYAGELTSRLEDLQSAFRDRDVRGVICTRGGWGSAELLPHLNAEDFRTAKAFIGYSDHTSLHVWLWNELRMQTFYAPMVAADWSKDNGVHLASWKSAVEGEGVAWHLGSQDGMAVLQKGEAQGRLLGGCLSILVEALGTPWALRIDEPCVLFLEDVGVKPYQWDRMLQHLQFAGMLKNVTGIVLGDMSGSVPDEELPLLRNACLHALRDFRGPIALGLRCGHVADENRSIVLGASVGLSCGDDARLTFYGTAEEQAP